MNVLQLQGEDINGDQICCSGEQVITVLNVILSVQNFDGFSWYAAALLSFPPTDFCQDERFEEVIDLNQLMKKISSVTQLEDGVVVAIRSDVIPNINVDFITAEAPMRKFLMQSILEIRMFDTSWIEVYTEIPKIVVALQSRFGGRLRPSEK